VTFPDDELVYPVAGLLGEPAGSDRHYHVGPVTFDAGDDLALASPVEGDLHLARTNRGLIVRARLAASLATSCSRCLGPIEVPLELAIDEEVLPSIELTSGLSVDASQEPDAIRLDDHHQLDLAPLVREAIQLAEPIAPRCRPDCPGLCPECGGDLADPAHPDHDVDLDPRLEALRAFKVDEERETD
jgi:uncharacterized protein